MPNQFPRGAKPSPRHKLAAATPHRCAGIPPTQFALVPTRLSFWGNQQDGDCVSAEEAFAKVAAAPNVFVTEREVLQWAGRHGWLNGAELPEVMDAMISEGMAAEDGKVYRDGPYKSVNWHDRATLCDAISRGPVKIAVAADQLEGPVTPGRNGWFATRFRRDDNTDHCVSLCGYGTLAYLFGALGKPVPAGADPNAFGYLLFTWNSVGVIDEPSMLAITAEAWLRDPTTAGFPTPPTPTPPAPPSPPAPPAPPPPAPTCPAYAGTASLSGHVPMIGQITLSGPVVLSPQKVGCGRVGFNWSIFYKVLDLVMELEPVILADVEAGKSVDQIVADLIAALLKSGHTAEGYGLTPDQWQKLITAVLQAAMAILGVFAG